MFGSEVLEVGIGMVLLFLFVSLIATAVQESIEALLKMRSKDLEKGLLQLLHSDHAVAALYNHPMIYSLYDGDYATAKKKNDLPSYIPARNFAGAVLDLVTKGGFAAASAAGRERGAQPATTPHTSAQEGERAAAIVKAIEAGIRAEDAVIEAGKTARGTAKAEIEKATPSADEVTKRQRVSELRETAELIQPPQLRKAVLALLDDAGNDLNKFRTGLEGWFDGTMDRVSGWYKRRSQGTLFWLGLATAIALNIDAITIAHRLSQDRTLREMAVKQAERLTAPVPPTEGGGPVTIPAALQAAKIDDLRKQLGNVGYPTGWVALPLNSDAWWPSAIWPAPQACERKEKGDCHYRMSIGMWLLALVGWLITALAIMLGAPFWFDILNKFMVIRSTVKPTEKSKDEGSEDRRASRSTVPRVNRPLEPKPARHASTDRARPPAPAPARYRRGSSKGSACGAGGGHRQASHESTLSRSPVGKPRPDASSKSSN
jgi:hypothetical protein